jgi:cysteine desulfurase
MLQLKAGLAALNGLEVLPAARQKSEEGFSPYIISAALKPVPAEVMVRILSDTGFCVSAGSACAAGLSKKTGKRSLRVMEAMGVDYKTAFSTIRISPGYRTTEEEIELFLKALHYAYKKQLADLGHAY